MCPGRIGAGGTPVRDAVMRSRGVCVDRPVITFAIASYNARAFLADAVASALGQRGVDVEVIVVDDGSHDGSLDLAEALSATDPRVRVLRTTRNLGPGGARNRALNAALGTWFAVLDSDDLLHPDRSLRLLAEAERSGADLIADDLLLFDDARILPPTLFLDKKHGDEPHWLELPVYLDETRMFGRRPNLGFLKPMIRTAVLRERAVRYDESLRIAEDDALIVALLRSGARYRLLPQPLYFYRKHGNSISHRLSTDHVNRMLAAGTALREALAADPALARALAPRDRALQRAWTFTHLLDALKARRAGAAFGLLLHDPGIVPMLHGPVAGAFRKLARRVGTPAAAPPPDDRAVLFVSRQRLIGATNGSSAYLLAIARAVRAAGLVPHLLQPSPRVFGRTPFYRVRPEMKVFESHAVHGAWRIGSWLIARDPRIALAGARGVLAARLRKFGVESTWTMDRKAPPSISAPWTRADLGFVAARARHRPAVAIADYVFQTEALPYLLDPKIATATVMHDLFHARTDQFAAGDDTVTTLDAAQEIALLAASDAVLAIQASEAAFVARHVPTTRAILVPMPADPVATAQPGDPDRLLFVGSNTAPNIVGLRWFLEEVWPAVRRARPGVTLDVAGTVARAFPAAPDGVRFLGLVDDLAALYAAAGIVISPLLQGSGLKIKLIEALAYGKATVVTATTLQGVEDALADAVVQADDADRFAAAITGLQQDDTARRALAERALAAARGHFGPDAAMAEFTAWLTQAAALRISTP